MNWRFLWQLLRLSYLLRVPLFTILLLGALGPLALGPAASLLRNLLDQSEYCIGSFLVSLGAFLLAYAAVTAISLTLLYGRERFPDNAEFPLALTRQWVFFGLGTAAAAVLAGCVVARSGGPKVPFWPHILACILGWVAAMGLTLASKVLQMLFTDPDPRGGPPPYLVFPAHKLPMLGQWFDRLHRTKFQRVGPLQDGFDRFMQWPLSLLVPSREGYLAPGGPLLRLLPGHIFALALSLMAGVVFALADWGGRSIEPQTPMIPALAHVLLFLNVACWGLSALTYFFDRYRFPLLWSLAGLMSLTAMAPQSDNFFRVEPRTERPEMLSAAQYLRKRIESHQAADGKVNLIFVASPGGGIQAAAWTAQVLAGLNKEIGDNDRFNKAVCFISSVSGGSLGAMVYTAGVAGLVADPAKNSMASAIDEVAWGWTHPDFWRAVAPWFGKRAIDRGWALEEKWMVVNGLRKDGRDVMLGDWAAQGVRLPALVLNSMAVESGQHVVFSTTKFPEKKDDQRGIRNFYDLYEPGPVDVRVATAARLSASFPYVAPAARPEPYPYDKAFHFVDGGYYDNYGIDSLIGWLKEAKDAADGELDQKIGDILILQLRHFPANQPPQPSLHGWFFQTFAPLKGLLSMWSAAAASRDENELELFIRTFNNDRRKVWPVTAQFQSTGEDCAPLSWKLSGYEQRCVDNAWEAVRGKLTQDVRRYLDRPGSGGRK